MIPLAGAGIRPDVDAVGGELSARLGRDHGLLSAPGELSLWRAQVLLGTAKLGRYDFSSLRELAIGVELLSLATEDHYDASIPLNPVRILGGDRRYATGLACICSAGRPELVEVVADALAEIAQSQARPSEEWRRTGERRGSVLAAAVMLGAISGEIPRKAGELLAGLAREAGMAAAEGCVPIFSSEPGLDSIVGDDCHVLRILDHMAEEGGARWP